MTELEKLDAGLEYCFFDADIVARKENALKGCAKFNAIDPADYEAQLVAIKELFGSTGENVYIQPDFNCDSGRNIHVGEDLDVYKRQAKAFADQVVISSFAVSAVAWARENGIMDGKDDNLFDPQGNVTRAEVATILMNYLTADTDASEQLEKTPEQPMETPAQLEAIPKQPVETPEQTDETSGVLVAYFTRTGTTEGMANAIHQVVGGDIFAIKTVTPYSSSYQEILTQAQQELQDNARPALSSTVPNMNDYDVIFIGYPIWHGTCPMAILTFLESYDLSGKTIVPFCTSGSSSISSSEQAIQTACPDSTILEGLGLTSSETSNPQSPVAAWLEELDLLPAA